MPADERLADAAVWSLAAPPAVAAASSNGLRTWKRANGGQAIDIRAASGAVVGRLVPVDAQWAAAPEVIAAMTRWRDAVSRHVLQPVHANRRAHGPLAAALSRRRQPAAAVDRRSGRPLDRQRRAVRHRWRLGGIGQRHSGRSGFGPSNGLPGHASVARLVVRRVAGPASHAPRVCRQRPGHGDVRRARLRPRPSHPGRCRASGRRAALSSRHGRRIPRREPPLAGHVAVGRRVARRPPGLGPGSGNGRHPRPGSASAATSFDETRILYGRDRTLSRRSPGQRPPVGGRSRPAGPQPHLAPRGRSLQVFVQLQLAGPADHPVSARLDGHAGDHLAGPAAGDRRNRHRPWRLADLLCLDAGALGRRRIGCRRGYRYSRAQPPRDRSPPAIQAD